MDLQQYFAKWGNEGVIDFYQEFSKLITLTAARTLLGEFHMCCHALRLCTATHTRQLSSCHATARGYKGQLAHAWCLPHIHVAHQQSW